MTEQEFRKALAENGFDEPVLVERKPGTRLDNHMHPFEMMAFIMSGDITLFTEHSENTYQAGQIFHLQANELHREAFGPQGVRYLSGRKNSGQTLHS
ncbi:cupin [Pantoea sp. LMR881]|uniref:cupin domain-containing protein n=1 Tax=Pantoea sp. LMR881 TaxID=3014336 RepID=UPI0022B053A5|nr:cupin [Pantoea sp. LMR881]MCZ4059036.1 cupin [Pantoea sp. LMR881]